MVPLRAGTGPWRNKKNNITAQALVKEKLLSLKEGMVTFRRRGGIAENSRVGRHTRKGNEIGGKIGQTGS